jgi:cytosine/adenosine deaminase-related metal-dependent hydrolase
VQYLLRHRTDLNPQSVIAMATMHAADALGRTDLGRLQPGSRAALGYVRTDAESSDDLDASLSENDFHPLW